MDEIELVWEEMMYRFYKDTHMGGGWQVGDTS